MGRYIYIYDELEVEIAEGFKSCGVGNKTDNTHSYYNDKLNGIETVMGMIREELEVTFINHKKIDKMLEQLCCLSE